jgi:hypothetical protein
VTLRDLCDELNIEPAAAPRPIAPGGDQVDHGAYALEKDDEALQKARDALCMAS